MSNGDGVLDNWEEIDEAGLCMTLQTKLQTDIEDTSSPFKPALTTKPVPIARAEPAAAPGKMKLLQRPQSMQENSESAATSLAIAPKQIMVAKKPSSTTLDDDSRTAPVLMVLHKSNSEYDAANYSTPITNQTVKILRRPAQSEERRDTNGMRPKQPIKTLQQREQEYAQARLRILGSAKNPEDDKPAAPAPTQPEVPNTPAFNFNNNNNNNNNNNSGVQSISNAPAMHRSSSAPKMSQAPPIYNNYNNYYQGPPNPAALGYFYQQTSAMQQQQQQQPQSAPPPHYNQRMPPYLPSGSAVGSAVPPTSNPQQSWSPVVGGSVSAALLRQQSLQQHQQHQQQHQVPPQPPQYAHPYNDSVLRLPRGPCPYGTIGFQMRR